MTEFHVGDRVRVLSTRATAFYAGRSGKVAWVDRKFGGGTVVSYLVHIDDDANPAPLAHAVFGLHELEAE